ncbi:hypothetical protein [Verrucomicrobium sp. BvORR106]|uniref:hypothetical protein n=1 Tax=Verrucomicrobium sp. BvORR106 TaxID=1403819 RepID=UPI002240FB93|nr:hypothetical protein [Verrucomicrobium sp. BvORR106]
MNTTAKTSAASLVAAAFISMSTVVSAQVTVAETSTTGYGTITTYSPGQTLVVNQESGSPISYSVTKQTTFVDEAGQPVEATHITSGVPISVSYVRDGDRMVASRVIVKKTVTTTGGPVATQTTRTTTTTTTGAGTISQFSPGQTIVLRSTSGPLTYATSSSTVYVDETGAPVAVEKISSGVPVTVHYVQEGDRMIANRVVVTRTTAVPTRPLTKDEREDLKEQREEAREDARERRKEAREEAKERREDLKDD